MENKDLILIDRYLTDSLSEAEKDSFNQRILTDSKFKELFQFVKDTQGAINETKKREFIKELDSVEADFHKIKNEPAKVIQMATYKKVLLAASVVLFLGIATNLFYNSKNSSDTIYSDADLVKTILLKSKNEVKLTPVYSPEIHNFSGSKGKGSTSSELIIFKIPVVILQDDRYPSNYFLKDTLYLFGSFSPNIILTIDSNTIYLKDGFKNYKLNNKESLKIEPLEQIKSAKKLKLQYETN